ncbi:class II aldolase/adducin family protein [Alteromonas sp. ASW11-130]|uniref:class II aldolase/adducin family protein n=1 Tax=Alteromonas sp. ASW11-130 TaxID=3015775 RepID=UPI0022422BF5|nr:class II aldolase/adducin family protein [Alteromonas sp. ASW11-130]MCW8091231.1 class II aldolase/adducin family protein [Alteromonas sp. ASW11-130]
MHAIENDVRQKLAIAHHVIAYYGWDELVATHLSARMPDSDAILITPKNTAFKNVTEENLVKLNLDGEYLSDNGHTVLEQAANIHLETYKVRRDIHSIIHTHSMYSTIISSLTTGFKFTTQHSLRFYDDIAYHPFDGLAFENEGAAIANSLGNKRVLFANNHGVITTGGSIEETLLYHYHLENCCETLVKTLQCSEEIIDIPDDICKLTKAQFDKIKTPHVEFAYFADLVRSVG